MCCCDVGLHGLAVISPEGPELLGRAGGGARQITATRPGGPARLGGQAVLVSVLDYHVLVVAWHVLYLALYTRAINTSVYFFVY